jgi:Sec-independent protein secretion pathway component TatC
MDFLTQISLKIPVFHLFTVANYVLKFIGRNHQRDE